MKRINVIIFFSILMMLLGSCTKKNDKKNLSEVEDKTTKESISEYFDFKSVPESPLEMFSYELTDDNSGVRIVSFKGEDVCRIPEKIEGLPVLEISELAFRSVKHKLQTCIMPDTVKRILINDENAVGMFSYFSELQNVKLSSSLEVIPENIFMGCERLEYLEIPESVRKIEKTAFQYSGLKSIVIPDSVIEVADCFGGCTKLETVRLPANLKQVPSFVLCESLDNIVLPEGITEIRSFSACKSLSSLKIPDSVTKIGIRAFSGCVSLTHLDIPDSVKIIEEGAFDNCGIISLEIPDSVIELNCSFAKCDSLVSLKLPETLEEISDELFHSEFDVHPFCYSKSLQSVNFPTSLKTVGRRAFLDMNALNEITIPDSLNEINFLPYFKEGYNTYENGKGESKAFEGVQLNLVTQKRIKDLGYTGKFGK